MTYKDNKDNYFIFSLINKYSIIIQISALFIDINCLIFNYMTLPLID